MKQVREDLRRGILPEKQQAFRERVIDTIDLVEQLCREAGATPSDLPAPSRNAYRFLRDIDIVDLPGPRTNAERAPRPIPVSNVVRAGNQLAERIWARRGELLSDDSTAERFRSEARCHADAIEEICRSRGGTPAAIPLPSRRVFCWIQFLGDGENLVRHAAALERGQRAISVVRPDLVEMVRIRLENFTPLWRTKNDRRGTLISVNEGFIDAPREIWEALAENTTGDGRGEKRRLAREYGESEEFAEIILDLDSRAAPGGEGSGIHHDLSASFDRVNAAYFGGRLTKPKLHWNEVPTIRKFGHYRRSRDEVMVSMVLDDPRVPEFVVDSIVHHELLHRVLGVEIIGDRAVPHSPEFRREERRFVRYREAQTFLTKLAGSLR